MKLEIINYSSLMDDLDDFCECLVELMQEFMLDEIDEDQLFRFDAFLNNEDCIRFVDGGRHFVSSKDILIGSVYNLIITKTPDSYVIELDSNAIIPNTYAKFIDIVSLINFGNLNVSPYPIYSDMMDYFAENLTTYIYSYLEDIGE